MFDGGQNLFVLQSVLEGRLDAFLRHHGLHKISERVHEGVFVTDDVSRRPPGSGVGMHALGHNDVAETALVFGVLRIEILQPVHVLKIKGERTLAAVDLEGDVILPALGEPRCLQVGHRAVFEAPDPGNRVVHRDLAHLFPRLGAQAFAGFLQNRPLLDEGLHQSADLLDLADEVASEVDDVGVDVAMRAGTRDLGLQTPDERKIRISNPVLGITGAIVINPVAEVAAFDHAFGQRDGGDAAIVVADHVHHPRLLHRRHHSLTLGHIHRERLLAEDGFAVFGRFQDDFTMAVVRRADIHDVDFRIAHHCLPVGARLLPAELLPGGLDVFGRPSANGVEIDPSRQIKKLRSLAPRIGMGLAHEIVSDHSDVECAFGHKGKCWGGGRLHQMRRRLEMKKCGSLVGRMGVSISVRRNQTAKLSPRRPC